MTRKAKVLHKTFRAITRANGISRVQTIKEEDSQRFYKSIESFRQIFRFPLVFNTCFNLPRVTNVETT